MALQGQVAVALSADLGQAPGTGTGEPPPLLVAISGWLREGFGIVLLSASTIPLTTISFPSLIGLGSGDPERNTR